MSALRFRAPHVLRDAATFALLSAAVAACADRVPSEPAAHAPLAIAQSPALHVASVPERAAARGKMLDELFDEVEAKAPGFAGIYYKPDGSGKIIVRVAGALQRMTALTASRSIFARHHRLEDANVEMLPAKYSWRQLRQWQADYYATGDFDGVVRIDVDEEANHLYIGASDAAVVSRLQATFDALRVPADARRIEVTARPKPVGTLDSLLRPIAGGTKMTMMQNLGGSDFPLECTMGQLVTLYGATYILTASHCTNFYENIGGMDNTTFYQPARDYAKADQNYVGQEALDPVFQYGLTGCPSGVKCRYSDAALIAVPNTLAFTVGRIARTQGYTTTSGALGDSTVIGVLSTKTELTDTSMLKYRWIHKVGQESGWTAGTLERSCDTVGLPAENGVPRWLLCQWSASATVREGDSGGPVFSYFTDGIDPVNNVWADFIGIVTSGYPSASGTYTKLGFANLSSIRGDLGGALVVKQ